MLNKSSNVIIHLKTGNRPYLVNKSDHSQNLAAGTVIAAFGRGRFVRHQAGQGGAEEDPKKEIKYRLSGPDQRVLYNGALTTVGALVEARRNSGPSPVVNVNYHKMIERPVDGYPGNFELQMVHDLRFTPSPAANVENEGGTESTASQTNVGVLLPLEAWQSFLSDQILPFLAMFCNGADGTGQGLTGQKPSMLGTSRWFCLGSAIFPCHWFLLWIPRSQPSPKHSAKVIAQKCFSV